MNDVKERVTHTPGPWVVSPPTREHPSQAMVTACSGFVGIYDAPLTSESAANARLIAAAPDLLAALQNFVECAVTDSECCAICTQDGRRHSEGCAVLVAEYAIEKAEGR